MLSVEDPLPSQCHKDVRCYFFQRNIKKKEIILFLQFYPFEFQVTYLDTRTGQSDSEKKERPSVEPGQLYEDPEFGFDAAMEGQ